MVEVSEERFATLAEEALATVPDALARLLDNVVLFIEDDPPSHDRGLLGVYEGIPLTERDSSYGGALPDRIVVYRNPTLAICDTEADVVAEVAASTAAGLLDLTADICPGGSCSAVSPDGMVRYRDGHHITVEQSHALATEFAAAIARVR